jgi:CIC family chloride channel protein
MSSEQRDETTVEVTPDEVGAVPHPMRRATDRLRETLVRPISRGPFHQTLRSQLARAGLVGLLAGSIGVLFGELVKLGEHLQHFILKRAHELPWWGIVVWPLTAAALAVFAAWLVARFAPETSGSGIPQIKGVLLHLDRLQWKRVLPVKLISGTAALTSGLSLGREGPTVQMGAAMGQLTALILRLPKRAHNQVIAAGAGAGLAAAFNAPLAGFIFVLEELQRELSPLTFSLALIACALADVIMRSVLGQQPSFYVRFNYAPPLEVLPFCVVVGIAASLVGWLFSHGLLGALAWAKSIPLKLRLTLTGLLAGGIGLLAWWLPAISGGGYATAQEVLSGKFSNIESLRWLLMLLALRLMLTVVSYATGAAGGIFAPMLAMGASLGVICGVLSGHMLPGAGDISITFAVVAMAALFSAVVRAPLTGIVLVIEMTANYALLLPLMVASLTAYVLAERMGYKPIYESLLEVRLGGDSGHAEEEDEPVWLDMVVEPHSPIDSKYVRELGWPGGCLIVTVTRGGHEHTPAPGMQLHAGDHLRIILGDHHREVVEAVVNSAKAHSHGHDAGGHAAH